MCSCALTRLRSAWMDGPITQLVASCCDKETTIWCKLNLLYWWRCCHCFQFRHQHTSLVIKDTNLSIMWKPNWEKMFSCISQNYQILSKTTTSYCWSNSKYIKSWALHWLYSHKLTIWWETYTRYSILVSLQFSYTSSVTCIPYNNCWLMATLSAFDTKV